MEKERLKTILAIPSVSGDESLVRNFIKEFAESNGIDHYIDAKGNIYLQKGEISVDEYYPCVVAHMDTVHRTHQTLINKDLRIDIVESRYEIDDENYQTILMGKLPGTDTPTGCGGDDKCGVFVGLEMFSHYDKLKGAFFVEEEIGMLGSREADETFFENVGYAIQFDAPSANWITETCNGVKLFDDDFKELIKETLSIDGYTNFSYDPFTDVNQLSQKFDFNCLNLGCGYYRQHTSGEYVIVEEVMKSLKAGKNLITFLGNKFHKHNKVTKPTSFETSGSTSPWYDVGSEDDELMDMSENIVDSVVSMIAQGADREQIKDFVYDYLEENSFY